MGEAHDGRYPVERTEDTIAYAIKAEVYDPNLQTMVFAAQKTMYGGKRIQAGDRVFIFASESQGGKGLVAAGIVVTAEAIAKRQVGGRETPRVSISVTSLVRAKRALGRDDLKRFTNWADGRPEVELNFKFYRQATNKIVGISDRTVAFLEEFF